MKFDKKLYVLIYTAARETARKYGFDIHTVKDITQDTAIEVLQLLADRERMEKVRNLKYYIRGIIIRKFIDHVRIIKKTELEPDDFDWLVDTIDESLDKLLDNQAKSFSVVIDDYIHRYPKSFTPQNKKLWEIFKTQKYTVPEMIEAMGMKSRTQFDTAKNRLVKRIIAIYTKIAASRLI